MFLNMIFHVITSLYDENIYNQLLINGVYMYVCYFIIIYFLFIGGAALIRESYTENKSIGDKK